MGHWCLFWSDWNERKDTVAPGILFDSGIRSLERVIKKEDESCKKCCWIMVTAK